MMSFPPIRPEILKLLRELYPEVFSHDEVLTSIEAMQLVRSYQISQLKKGVTNLTMGIAHAAGFSFSYSYTRQNLHFCEQPKLCEIYPGLKTSHEPYYSSFHTSGQAAISSLLLGLSQLYPEFHLHLPSRAYYETPKALKLINKGDEKPKGPAFLFLDSTSLEPEHVEQIVTEIHRFPYLIIDTSLWCWDDPLMQTILDHTAGKIPVFIVRSHLKLDCLGGEYATLGSLVYIPTPETTEEKRLQIVEKIQFASSSIAGCPQLDAIYPFYKNPSFHDLTRKRIKEIKDSLNRIIDDLTPLIDTRYVKFEVPYHRMFFFLNFHCDDDHFNKIVLKLIKVAEGKVFLMDSYGFDFPTILVTRVRHDMNEYFIRLNGHVLGRELDGDVKEAYRSFIELANKHARR